MDQLAPRIEAIIDDACRVQSSLESEGRPLGVALEHAFNRTSSKRRALVKEYSDDGVLRFADQGLGPKLAAVVGTPAKPCATVVALWAFQRWPEVADQDLLRRVLQAPPGGSTLLASRAIDAMAETGQVAFLDDLGDVVAGPSHPRLVWHALTALTRIEGNGDRLMAFIRDADSPFDREVSLGLSRTFAALPRDEHGPVAAALLEDPSDPHRRQAGIRLARRPDVAELVAPDILRIAESLDRLDAEEARDASYVLQRGLPDQGMRQRRQIASNPRAPATLRLAVLPGLGPDTIEATLSELSADRVDGPLLVEALQALATSDPQRAQGYLERLGSDDAIRNDLARAAGCAGAPDADATTDDCLQRLLGPT